MYKRFFGMFPKLDSNIIAFKITHSQTAMTVDQL